MEEEGGEQKETCYSNGVGNGRIRKVDSLERMKGRKGMRGRSDEYFLMFTSRMRATITISRTQIKKFQNVLKRPSDGMREVGRETRGERRSLQTTSRKRKVAGDSHRYPMVSTSFLLPNKHQTKRFLVGKRRRRSRCGEGRRIGEWEKEGDEESIPAVSFANQSFYRGVSHCRSCYFRHHHSVRPSVEF